MSTVKVTWHHGMTFTGTAPSGFSLPLGTNPDSGGDNDGFRPMELLAVGLAGCTAMDVISILEKKRETITAFDVQVYTTRANEHPHVFTSADIEYSVTGRTVNEKAVLRAIELSATRYCSAMGMFKQLMPITLKYQIFEESGAGNTVGNGGDNLVKSGEYHLPQIVAE